MPRTEKVFGVFVSSPSDLEDERNRLNEVIQEFNITWSQNFGIRLDLIRWETHGYPGIGKDPQDVLNQELPDDFDIFIGLMWGRFGTETERAGSGTEEEFHRALKRYRKDPNSVKIMFYFKDAPISPSDIDPDQLKKVNEFRTSLGSKGSLFWEFKDLNQFEQLLRQHLSRQVQEFARSQSQEDVVPSTPSQNRSGGDTKEGETNDLGFLDYIDKAEEDFSALTEITSRIVEQVETLGKNMNKRTEEIEAALTQTQGQMSRSKSRSLIDHAATDMNHFVSSMAKELPLFRETLERGADAVVQIALISIEFASEDKTQIREMHGELYTLLPNLEVAFNNLGLLKNSVEALPRMTSNLNRAKRETVEVLDKLLDNLAEGHQIVEGAVQAIDVILDENHTQ